MSVENKGRKCFIITPIGDANSETFRKAQGVIESVIKPVLESKGFGDIKPSYDINNIGMISTQIINRIINDDLVIANLTGTNPNVMYELCLRHVVAKPIIHICENGTDLPFDIKDCRTIFYQNDMLGVRELNQKINDFLEEIIYENDYKDNPVYVADKYNNLLKQSKGVEDATMLSLLMEMSSDIASLKRENEKLEVNLYKDKIGKNNTRKFYLAYLPTVSEDIVVEIWDSIPESGLTVIELANRLETSTEIILMIANGLGFKKLLAESTISKEIAREILKYILSMQKWK